MEKSNTKKNIIYSIVLVIIFAIMGWVIKTNFFSARESEENIDLDGSISSDISNIKIEEKNFIPFSEDELNFLLSKQFKNLVDNSKVIKAPAGGNRDIFLQFK